MKKILILILLTGTLLWAQKEAIVTRDNTHVRQGAGSYYPLLGVLQKGTSIKILSEVPGWLNILISGQSGWVSQNAVASPEGTRTNLPLSEVPGAKPMMVSSASASGAVKGFAQTYLSHHKTGFGFIDQYDVLLFDASDYQRFRDETYRGRNPEKIRKRYKKIKNENKNPEITGYLEKLGLAVAAQIAAGGLEQNQPQIVYLNMVGNLVAEMTPLYDYPFKFYILSESRPVGYAAPNGMIFISRGLLNIISSEAELACVLGHEITHVVQQHGYAEVLKRRTLIIAEDAFSELDKESPGGFSDAELEDLAIEMYNTSTSRRQIDYEYEADQLGSIYAYRAGYDPRGLTKVLKSIKAASSPDFWHPESNWQYDAIEDRVEVLSLFISRELGSNPDWNVSNVQRFRASIR